MSLEDFIFHGLQGIVDLELVGFDWKIGPVDYVSNDEVVEIPEITDEVKISIMIIVDIYVCAQLCSSFPI